MKLYSFSGSCGLASNITLAWAKADYEVALIEKSELKSPALTALNPNQTVPILEDGDFNLFENAALLYYIAEKHPEAKLLGAGSLEERARVLQWLAFINSDIHPAFKPLFGATAYLEDKALIALSHTHAKNRIRTYFERINQQLVGKNYLTGSRSIADAYLYVVLSWAKPTGIEIGDLKEVQAFQKRMNEDPSVLQALKEQKLL